MFDQKNKSRKRYVKIIPSVFPKWMYEVEWIICDDFYSNTLDSYVYNVINIELEKIFTFYPEEIEIYEK